MSAESRPTAELLHPYRLPLRLFVAALACILTCSLQPAAAQSHAYPIRIPASRPGVLPDNVGAISEILLHYATNDGVGIRAVFDDLFDKMPNDVAFVVACPDRAATDEFEQNLGQNARMRGRRVRTYNVGIDISIWARDRCIARQFPGGRRASYIVPRPTETYDIWRLNEHYSPFALEAAGVLHDVKATPVALEGGNLISSSRYAFIGANVLADNDDPSADPVDPGVILRHLRSLVGRQLILVESGDSEVPWEHIDMYLTPIGDNSLLVADPALADEILGLGQTRYEFIDDDAADEMWASHLMCRASFDAVAEQMASTGFQVNRLPAIVNSDEEWMITYNNVLQDERGGCTTVYMPVYGIAELDDYAARTYQHLGLHVETVDVSGIYEHGGAVRCVANVTRRQPRPRSAELR